MTGAIRLHIGHRRLPAALRAVACGMRQDRSGSQDALAKKASRFRPANYFRYRRNPADRNFHTADRKSRSFQTGTLLPPNYSTELSH